MQKQVLTTSTYENSSLWAKVLEPSKSLDEDSWDTRKALKFQSTMLATREGVRFQVSNLNRFVCLYFITTQNGLFRMWWRSLLLLSSISSTALLISLPPNALRKLLAYWGCHCSENWWCVWAAQGIESGMLKIEGKTFFSMHWTLHNFTCEEEYLSLHCPLWARFPVKLAEQIIQWYDPSQMMHKCILRSKDAVKDALWLVLHICKLVAPS